MPFGCRDLSCLSSRSPVFISSFHQNFSYLQGLQSEIVKGVAWAVETAGYWFLCPPVCDATSMSVEADMTASVLCYRQDVYHWLSVYVLVTIIKLVCMPHTSHIPDED